ncbi:hypothetical protein ISN76_16495 [Dyella halodurans]|uniref:Cobalamin ABC transporter n=1 Tax=Dyella halodurans TaxID=1920171 RepID=A0ABV9C7G7_9GAMM|nr:hypothetical protein [Dyella halodurans]
MKLPSGLRSASLFGLLVLLMLSTRFKHFGDVLHLADASMAVFFVGGLMLRRHAMFASLVALAMGLDWVAIQYAGVSDFCVTPAYAFLPLAYAVLWYGGRWYAPRLRSSMAALLGAWAVAPLAASLSFAISNGAFYWLGGRYAQPHVAEYVSRLWQWGPLFVRTTLAYVAVALVAYAIVAGLMSKRGVSLAQQA